MQKDAVYFTWPVPEAGYDWIETRSADPEQKVSGPFLTYSEPRTGARYRALRTRPLDEQSGLFRIFAGLEPTRKSIKTFANKYGWLGGVTTCMIALPGQPGNEGEVLGSGEPLSAWATEIRGMREVVELWEDARSGDAEKLQARIRWEGEDVFYDSHPELGPNETPPPPEGRRLAMIASPRMPNASLLERFAKGDVIEPALALVQSIVDKRLEKMSSARLLWEEGQNRMTVYHTPDGLIGALWLQFALAIQNDNAFRQCAECGLWFEVTPQKARSSKIFCSNACRTKAYRKRKARAVAWWAEGRTMEDIAHELDADPRTVAGWVKKANN